MITKRVIGIVVFVMLFLSIVACNEASVIDPLVGIWDSGPVSYSFNEDGTGENLWHLGDEIVAQFGFEWTRTEEDFLIIDFGEGDTTHKWNYEIDDNDVLRFSGEDAWVYLEFERIVE